MAKAPVKQTRHPAKAVLRPTVIVFGLGPSVDQLNNKEEVALNFSGL
ncbi:hypothetical protein I314_06555 [Cryptococcus bacillisporus CA1873]|uniref:Uncharacterized protein n=1 Tax=Cryptococcus bacillisporus CA1873 TaxID=1296111 RepID=A0ABR5B240_CRYGA|nr:hypothetical protein I314_06555 [Cryptococcus bacillisporus CA1873]|eukprot:KIR57660.1 hypothetical protein I314_06555 [Cryptococcus gattii CA1873]